MAGLGRKTFTAGEVLTAANVQGYLQDQTVMKYANTSAVSSAVGTALSDGMQFFLTDTDETVYHNGTTFAKEGSSGNAIINGAFDIWQRGTSFTTSGNYTADRFAAYGTFTITRDTDVPAGIGAKYSLKIVTTAATTLRQVIENGALNNETARTGSYYAKVASGTASIGFEWNDVAIATHTVTTSWQRFTASTTSLAAGTGGDNTILDLSLPTGATIYITGVQDEAGSVATPFKRNAPSIQAELAACQRYYQRIGADSVNSAAPISTGFATSTTTAKFKISVSGKMRTGGYSSISFVAGNGFRLWDGVNSALPSTAMAVTGASGTTNSDFEVVATVASGLTQYRSYNLIPKDTTATYIEVSDEL